MMDRIGQSFGNYHLLRLLGTGNFAAVYLGEHQYLEILAAIKVLHLRMEVSAHDAFRREARTIAHLQHPHIIRVLDFGIEGETPYLAMEYSPNGTLRTRHCKETRLSFEQIVTYVKQIAQALDFAHAQRVIHRDIKPENILLNSKGEIVLSDFGLAVVQRTLASLSEQKIAGTPLYMAPEQIHSRPCPQSDQYALAVIVYEWLCGQPPFQGPLYEVLSHHLYQPPPGLCARVPQLPSAVEEAVFVALAKDPTHRFPTVQDFANALEEACFATQPFFLRGSASQEPQGQTTLPVTYAISLPDVPLSEQEPSDETTQPRLKALQGIDREPEPVQSIPSQPATHNQVIPEPVKRSLAQPDPYSASPPALPPLRHRRLSVRRMVLLLVVLVLLIVGADGALSLRATPSPAQLHPHASTTPQDLYHQVTQSPPTLNDPLRTNGPNNWTESTSVDGKFSCQFTGEAYHASTQSQNTFMLCVAQATHFGDLAYQVQMTIAKGDFGGMVFRSDDSQTKYYSFFIDRSGTYTLITSVDNTGTHDYVLHKGTSSFIRKSLNQVNLLAVIARGSTIYLYINQQYITSASDSTYHTGQIGLFGGNTTTAPADVLFRHVQVWNV